ncbi:MAG: polysulfide reductase NrfD [Chloroflexi bacterium]|nr:polysulfide reductase NrfD [Chloroflexota bacterium]MCY3936812.1 polysulfide reductase NrfD [Chloroflexota bacterium]
MQEPVVTEARTTDRELLDFVMRTPRWFFGSTVVFGAILAAGFAVFILLLMFGLQYFGYSHPVYWSFPIVNLVFWIGISHAGIMVSAILRLSQAEWRRPVTRAAEVLTIFSLLTAMLMPIVHSGRPWRTLYWEFPYDWIRGAWPNPRSPLVWDPSAIFTYLLSTLMFVYIALLPDLALARDKASDPVRRVLFTILAMGFRGTSRQWRIQAIAGILLSAIILPIFVSVHSIVSWDFAVTSLPGWHNTVFAPYFVIGAVHSGVSAVVTVTIVLRKILKLENYIKADHIDSLARLLIAVAVTWGFFLFLDFGFGLYGEEPAEVATWMKRTFEMPWLVLAPIFIFTAFLFPVPMWLFRNVRRSFKWMFITTVSVNIGMWLERYLLIVPGLERKSDLQFVYGEFTPSWGEGIIVTASFALVMLGVLTFAKLLPIIPAADVKEGQILAEKFAVGKTDVPAAMRE